MNVKQFMEVHYAIAINLTFFGYFRFMFISMRILTDQLSRYGNSSAELSQFITH